MAAYYIEAGHTTNDLTWLILEHVAQTLNCEQILLEREQRWVFRLGTHLQGQNDEIPWWQLNR